jgi:membrane-bound metal-dependent hydrolase YbcI (DUF457 family)
MPSPLGHGLVGLAVHAITAREAREAGHLWRAAIIAGAAMAPDLDLLFKFVDGRNHHQAETHSIGAAILAGVATFLIAKAARWRAPLAFGAVVGLAWLTHPLLDYLGNDTHPPIGLMLLWPFDQGFYKSPWIVFMDIGRTLDWRTVRHNVVAIAWELLVLAPVVGLAGLVLRRRYGAGVRQQVGR